MGNQKTPTKSAQESCREAHIGYDPQDIEATLGWMETARQEKNQKALDDLFWKVRLQIDALEEEYKIEAPLPSPR